MGDHSRRQAVSTEDPQRSELLGIALDAADQAARLIRDGRPDKLTINRKTTATDNVTDMDLASEALIRALIKAARPLDRFVGEESSNDPDDHPGPDHDGAQVTWIVDPIDGTTNYVYDLPGYNISIAAAIGDRVVVGVVADPAHHRVYSALLGGGAFCDDARIDLVGRESHGRPPGEGLTLEKALIATGFAYSPHLRARQGEVVAGLLPRVRDIRRLGAAALDLCHVASGRVDGYFEVNLAPWDIAAGALIATEAGARVEPIRGGPDMPTSIVAATPEIFEDLQATLAQLGAGSVMDR